MGFKDYFKRKMVLVKRENLRENIDEFIFYCQTTRFAVYDHRLYESTEYNLGHSIQHNGNVSVRGMIVYFPIPFENYLRF